MEDVIIYLIPLILILWAGIGLIVVKKKVRMPGVSFIRLKPSARRFTRMTSVKPN